MRGRKKVRTSGSIYLHTLVLQINDAIDTLEKKEGSVTPINSIKPVDKKPVVPNTGDENLMSLYISLIGIMAGLFVIIKKRKNIY